MGLDDKTINDDEDAVMELRGTPPNIFGRPSIPAQIHLPQYKPAPSGVAHPAYLRERGRSMRRRRFARSGGKGYPVSALRDWRG
jgi:hypothetical protein